MSSERADVYRYNVVDFFILDLSEIAVLIYLISSLTLSSIILTIQQILFTFLTSIINFVKIP